MEDKHEKRCSTSLVIRKMHVLKLHLDIPAHLPEYLKLKTMTPNASEKAEKLYHSCIIGGTIKLYSYSGKQFGSFLNN